MMRRSSRYSIRLAIAAVLALAGCHSAFFQTAKIRNGVDATVGLTKARAADHPDVSDYSIYVKGEIGRAARKSSFGYSVALTCTSPFKNRQREFRGGQEWETGTFPNEEAGVLPEFKLQFPRKIPVDFALDVRLMAIYPERIALLASEDVMDWMTLYQTYAVTLTEGQLLCLGAELELTDKVSIFVEGTRWLSEHQYPDDYMGPTREYPHCLGLAISYHLPRKTEQHDTRDLAGVR